MSMLSRFASLGGINDPYWANVVLMMPCNNFTDYSPTPKTVTSTGSTISTSPVKYGTGSIYNPTGSTYTTAANSASQLSMETLDFTIEFWLYVTSWAGFKQHVSTRTSNSPQMWGVDSRDDGTIYLHSSDYIVTSSAGHSLNAWNYVTFTRQSGVIKVYINGVLEGTSTNMTLSGYNFVADSGVGLGAGSAGYQGAPCYIDELRITKGVCRYTTNFTPPTGSLPIG